MKRFLVCSLATLAMVACVNEDVVETPKSDIIRFADAHINNSTRAVEAVDPSTTKATLDAFDVWAYMTSTDGTVLDRSSLHGCHLYWMSSLRTQCQQYLRIRG